MICSVRTMLFVVIVALMVCCGAAYCDDSAMSMVNGGTVQPMDNHPSICMVRETVDIKLGARVGYEWPVFVRCQFEFRNDGAATHVFMGFPEKAEGSGDGSAAMRIKGFKSWVDGTQMRVKYVPSSQKDKGNYDSRQSYKAWYIKNVHFDAGQSRRVVIVYSARLGLSNTAASPEGMEFLLGYILRTGANWKGPIGEAVINADLSAAGNRYRIAASPSGYQLKNNRYTWTLKNFEPKEDIDISFKQIFPHLNGRPTDYTHCDVWEPCFERNGATMANPNFLSLIGAKLDLKRDVCKIEYAHHILKLRAGSTTALLDGRKIKLAQAPWQNEQQEVYAIPVEETVRLLGGRVDYDSHRRPNICLKSR